MKKDRGHTHELVDSFEVRDDTMDILAAIDHCDEVASRNDCNCGAEHRQLAAWLRELEQARQTISRLKDVQLDAVAAKTSHD